MADRVVKVTLRAQIAEYKQGMLEAAQATRTVGSAAEKLAQQKQAFQQIGAAAVAVGVTVGAVVTAAVAKFADFDQAMSNVAATGEDARDNMDALRDAALDAGAATVFSASESANAIEEMAKAGIDAKDILGGGLAGALDLAAAGGLEVADAAGVAATALKTFKLEGTDMAHVADLLAAGAGKAMGDVSDLSQALSQGGQAAALTGLSIEETTASLAAFASQGLIGSDAGTSLKTMLLSLNPTTDKAAQLMDTLNLRAFDQQGQFIGVAEYAGKLESALGTMSAEQQSATLKTIFGTDAYRAAAVMLDQGETGMRDWIAAVDDSGYAAETAATRLDNLKGDWEALSGAVDSALIGMGEAADGPLRFLVQSMADVVDGFNDMPAGAQQAVFWVGLVGSAAATAGGAYLLAVPKVVEYKNAITQLGPAAQRTSRAMGALAGAVGVFAAVGLAVAGLEAVGDALRGVEKTSTELANTLTKGSLDKALAQSVEGTAFPWEIDKVKTNIKDLRGVLDQMQQGAPSSTSNDPIDIWFDQLSASVSNLGDALAEAEPDELAATLGAMQDAYGLTDANILTLIDSSAALRESLVRQADAAGLAASDSVLLDIALEGAESGTDDAAAAVAEFEQEVTDAKAAVSDLDQALDDIGATAMGMGEAIDAAQSAINDLAAAAKAEGTTIDGTNGSSIALRDAMREVETSHRDAAQAIIDNGGTLDDAKTKYNEGRAAIIELLESRGMDADAAAAWADAQLGSASEVQGALEDLKGAVDAVPDAKDITVTTSGIGAAEGALADLARDRTATIKVKTSASGTPGFSMNSPDYASANGNLFVGGEPQAFYQGGFPSGVYAGVNGGIHKFAESEMGVPWETYISGRTADRDRNIGIWQETGQRLGVSAQPASPGGVRFEGGIHVTDAGLSHGEVVGILRDEINKRFNRGGL